MYVNSFLYIHAGAPEKVHFKQAIVSLTSITISWDKPPSDNGVIVEYVIQSTYGEKSITMNTAKEMHTLVNLSPSTRVEFTVRAVSICGAIGIASTTSEATKSIRKLMAFVCCHAISPPF